MVCRDPRQRRRAYVLVLGGSVLDGPAVGPRMRWILQRWLPARSRGIPVLTGARRSDPWWESGALAAHAGIGARNRPPNGGLAAHQRRSTSQAFGQSRPILRPDDVDDADHTPTAVRTDEAGTTVAWHAMPAEQRPRPAADLERRADGRGGGTTPRAPRPERAAARAAATRPSRSCCGRSATR